MVFSSPQLAYVGLHEETAVEEVGDVDIYSSVSTYAPLLRPLFRSCCSLFRTSRIHYAFFYQQISCIVS